MMNKLKPAIDTAAIVGFVVLFLMVTWMLAGCGQRAPLQAPDNQLDDTSEY